MFSKVYYGSITVGSFVYVSKHRCLSWSFPFCLVVLVCCFGLLFRGVGSPSCSSVHPNPLSVEHQQTSGVSSMESMISMTMLPESSRPPSCATMLMWIVCLGVFVFRSVCLVWLSFPIRLLMLGGTYRHCYRLSLCCCSSVLSFS